MTAYKVLIYFLIFFAAAVTAYAVVPVRFRRFALLIPSVLCYGFFCGLSGVFLPVTIASAFFAARGMDALDARCSFEGLEKDEKKIAKAKLKVKKRWILFGFVFLNLGILAVLKYFNFFASSVTSVAAVFGQSITLPVLKIALPLGISYYTLQAIGYVTDVLRGKYKAEKNFFNLALFIGFFPQLNEGPFGRYDTLINSLTEGAALKAENVFRGIARILVGLCKLFVIADRAALITGKVFSEGFVNNGFTVILGTLAFTLQLYADFSGYIDVASGVAEVFGIHLMKNFDMPFVAQSVGEFWRRWHISLGSWFRDYVFYPVSTAKPLKKLFKKASPKTAAMLSVAAATLAVWFLTGLWHGAAAKYIVYGMYYGVLMLIYTALSPKITAFIKNRGIAETNKLLVAVRTAKTFLLVQIGMLMFRANDLKCFIEMLVSVFKFKEYSLSLPGIELPDFLMLIAALAVISVMGIMAYKGFNFTEKFDSLSSPKKYWICFAIFVITAVFGAYGLGYLPPDPIYGGF